MTSYTFSISTHAWTPRYSEQHSVIWKHYREMDAPREFIVMIHAPNSSYRMLSYRMDDAIFEAGTYPASQLERIHKAAQRHIQRLNAPRDEWERLGGIDSGFDFTTFEAKYAEWVQDGIDSIDTPDDWDIHDEYETFGDFDEHRAGRS